MSQNSTINCSINFDLVRFHLIQTASKGIGLAIVVFSAILKVPQILKILKAKSAEGLSYTSFLMEVKTYHKTSLPL